MTDTKPRETGAARASLRQGRHRSATVAALLSAPMTAILIFSYLIPVVLVIVTGFFTQDEAGRLSSTATLANFVRFFSDGWYVGALLRSIRIAACVTVLAVALGYLAAYFMVFRSGRWLEALVVLTVAPILVGNVVRAFGWLMMMGDSGLVNSLLAATGAPFRIAFMYKELGIIVADASNLLPLSILVLVGVLTRIDRLYLEAAAVLGANPLRSFRSIMLPLSMPGITAAAVICFTLALGTFEIAVFIGGKRVEMIAPLAYDEIAYSFDWPMGAAVALILLVTSLVGIVVNDFLEAKATK
jgi:putative spermidine/putrescine transport system permease protein